MVGGSRRSLNIRAARAVLRALDGQPPTHSVLVAKFSALLDHVPTAQCSVGRRLTDAEVRDRIRTALRKQGQSSASKLLRAMRDDGLACEQRRFHTLFDEVQGEFHGA